MSNNDIEFAQILQDIESMENEPLKNRIKYILTDVCKRFKKGEISAETAQLDLLLAEYGVTIENEK